ncbi:uncharacterized protein [Elaeis guineensis]|uniref:uncharacterized protein n=1 Tax=Elaeis guineensis var. tenera TaxID=51953 RepID=UPI003C6D1CC5
MVNSPMKAITELKVKNPNATIAKSIYGHKERYCWFKEKLAKFVEETGKVENEYLFFASSSKESNKSIWYIDSGCSSHMTGNMEAFTKLDKSLVSSQVKMGDIRKAQGKGIVKLNSCGMNSIKDVLYVPDLDPSLLSVGQFLMEGYSLVFEDLKCCVYKDRTKTQLVA